MLLIFPSLLLGFAAYYSPGENGLLGTPHCFGNISDVIQTANVSLKITSVSKGTVGEGRVRSRRGILELAGAIRCTTGRSPFAYLRYGCYCGLGGKGWPMDRVDWCCFHHDCCYGRAEQAGCQPKTESYHWECKDNSAVCDSLEDKCQKMACECDREAAKCFSKAPYHRKYLLWPDFMCGEIQPLCRY
ncbi:group 10 secretory phospholipase A2 isoform X3 [Serinus canaria]|uniref:group 10 secretory phospholipase A2 isoform X3 n=1 Tax=Serinus canaria TaxID=9135 RepID=UPI0021CD086D|nr:group 10 secretory phospholipase A2 isoform X3 [Serinus canaria]